MTDKQEMFMEKKRRARIGKTKRKTFIPYLWKLKNFLELEKKREKNFINIHIKTLVSFY